MTIKFICGCGKHLRARDEMAARRSVCPRCGSPVGIPSLEPNNPGAAGPLSPLERQRLAKQRPTPGGRLPREGITVAALEALANGAAPPEPALKASPPQPLDFRDVRKPDADGATRKPRRRGWQLE